MTLTSCQRPTLAWGGIAAAIGILLWILRPVLTPFLPGALIAYALQPGVEWMVRQRVPRAVAVLVMMFAFASVLTLLPLLVFAVVQLPAFNPRCRPAAA